MKLALVHDVAEAIVGDITPTCGVSDDEKYRLEAEAVQKIKAMLGGSTLAGGCMRWWVRASMRPGRDAETGAAHVVACESEPAALLHLPPLLNQPPPTKHKRTQPPRGAAGEEVEALWHEYEQGQTLEAKLVKDFDKVGAGWQVGVLGGRLPVGGCRAGSGLLASAAVPSGSSSYRWHVSVMQCHKRHPLFQRPATPTPPPPTQPPLPAKQLEMILQAHEYECQQGMLLQEFFDSTDGKWRTDLGRSWAEEICRRRVERQQQQQQAAAAGAADGSEDAAT